MTRAGGDAAIVVRDSDVGIQPEDLSLIFEPFGQAGSSTNGLLGGVGLGLYIVKRLVELLGGTIDVDSTLGGGTAFHVRVPLHHPSSEAVSGEHAA